MAGIAFDVLYFSTIRDVSSDDRIRPICRMYYLSTAALFEVALLVVCEPVM